MVAAVPWARHGAWFTRAFEDTAAWLAVHTSRVAVAELLRVAWRTAGRIVTRVVEEASQDIDRLEGLRRIGIDEISHRKGHRYLTVVVDHDTGRLVWAAPGHDEQTLERFFDALGADRASQLTHVSADAAAWIANTVARRCPAVVLCLDPFHVVRWATDALDEVRRQTWNAARRDGQPALARELKGARFALWKNPEHLTVRQRGKLARVAQVNQHLYKAYLLKEELRLVFKLKGARAVALLDAWLVWARRCRIPAFVKLARSITDHRAGIQATLLHGLSNGLVESVNTKLRLLTRIAFGFRSQTRSSGSPCWPSAACARRCPDELEQTHGYSRRAQKDPGAGAGPHRPDPAAAARGPPAAHPRRHPPRDHQPVCRAGGGLGQGHLPDDRPPPRHRVPSLPGPHRPGRTCRACRACDLRQLLHLQDACD